MTAAKRCVLYARVSDDDQDPAMQLDEIRAFVARREGWTVVAEYVDHGVTGAKDRRPQLDEAMTRIRSGGVEVVLVWKFSRFARSVRHLVTALDEFKALGVDFVSMSEGIDTTTPVGRLTFHVIGAIDEFFLDTLKENTRAGVARARRQGKHIGRRHRLGPVEVARVVAMRAEGKSQRDIAIALKTPRATIRRAMAGHNGYQPSVRETPVPRDRSAGGAKRGP